MSTKLQRAGLLGSVAAISLLGATTAQAVETKFGDVSIVFDTTVSMGASMRTAGRQDEFLPEGNGGPIDIRNGTGAVFVDPDAGGPAPLLDNSAVLLQLVGGAGSPVGGMTFTANPDNYDGSVNTDDGRLNYDAGDLIGTNIKASHDLQISWQNYKIFARAIGFYDVILADKGAGERSLVDERAIGDVGRNYELLDLFVSADYTVADMPVNLRVGKQVINWGESTFILNGNNPFNPIDVAAFRRPGAEIKEGLVPVNAISGSISLPFDVSLSGYYALDWEPFELDPGGTPFAGSDAVALGSGFGGNQGAISLLSGSPYSGMRRNCKDNNPFVGGTQASNAVVQGLLPSTTGALGDGVVNCSDGSALTGVFAGAIDYRNAYTIGSHETVKIGLPSLLAADGWTRPMQGIVERTTDIEANDMGTWGLSARYYADWLEGTEFGFYFQNYHSRLPFANLVRLGRPQLGFATETDSVEATSASNRGLLPAGCGLTAATTDPATTAGAAIATRMALFNATNNVLIDDPMDLLNPTVATQISTLTAGQVTLNPGPGGSLDTVQNALKLNCMTALYQTVTLGPSLLLMNGAEHVGLNSQYALSLEYPEDIRMWGFSFNTTLMGWGVQGDFTYRPDAPFQVDTDSLTIWNGVADCALIVGTGGVSALLAALTTRDGNGTAPTCGNPNRSSAIIENEMFTAQIGTTATFTASEWWMDYLAADVGFLVTEVGMVYVPGVEDTWLNKNTNQTLAQYQPVACQGSDLGLGGILGLDPRLSKQCRPNDFSSGLVMLFRLEYNNAFDTGFVVAPQISYSYDFVGNTPSPYGNYLEDRQALSLGVTGTLNNNFRVGANYTDFFGGGLENKAKDTDFASVTASYTF